MSAVLTINQTFAALPVANEVANTQFAEVIGNKTDVSNNTAGQASIIGLLRFIEANLSTDTDVAALIGALNTATATGAVGTGTTVMGYVKQLVTALNIVKGDLDNGGRLDLLIDAIKLVTDAIPDAGALTSLAQNNTVAKAASIGTITNSGGTDTIGAILGDFANTTLVSKFAVPTQDLATDVLISQVVGKKSDTVAGTSLVALAKQIIAATLFPTTDLATDATIAQVVGKKADTVSGNSLVALSKQVLATTAFPTQDLATDTSFAQVIGKKSDTTAGTSLVSLVKVANAHLDGTTTNPNAVKREAGRTQIKIVPITSAANAGLVTLATVTTQPVLIKSVVLRCNTASSTDLTSAAIKGGTSQALVLIDAGTAIKASLDAVDEQVSFSGAATLDATKTIVVDLQGTGATTVDLVATIEYVSTIDGGYLA